MKVTLENPTRMVLKDRNFGNVLGAVAFFLAGVGIIYLGGAKNLLVIGLGGIFAIAGLFMFANARFSSVSLDKGEGRCKFSSWGILKKEQKEIELGKITGVELNCSVQTKTNRRSFGRHRSSTTTFYQYQLVFTLADGMSIPLEFGRVRLGITNLWISPHEKKMADAKQVAEFLGVPLKEELPPSPFEEIAEAKDKPFSMQSSETS